MLQVPFRKWCSAIPCRSARSAAWQACVVERGTALGARHLAIPFEDPRDQRFARLRNIRHPGPV